MNLRVRHVAKNKNTRDKTRLFFHCFFLKFSPQIDGKCQNNGSRNKSHEQIAPGRGLFRKKSSLGRFWAPRWEPNVMKHAFEKAIAKKAEQKSIGCAGSASCAGPAGGGGGLH